MEYTHISIIQKCFAIKGSNGAVIFLFTLTFSSGIIPGHSAGGTTVMTRTSSAACFSFSLPSPEVASSNVKFGDIELECFFLIAG